MTVALGTPTEADLQGVLRDLAEWQRDDAPVQLHPGDVGWHSVQGTAATAAALRTWRRRDELVALGFLDGPGVLRLTVSPGCWDDEALARRVVADLAPTGSVLPAGDGAVEAPDGTAVRAALDRSGWQLGESWTPLRRDLRPPVEDVDLDVVVVGPDDVADFTAVHRSAWGSERFTDERWHTMASGPAYAHAACLLGRDERGTPVAGLTVWSAGRGRPGLLEPLGVHADHRGRGHGRAICVAGAATLARMGACSAMVCTQTALTGAVATYLAAGFERLPERLDRVRPR